MISPTRLAMSLVALAGVLAMSPAPVGPPWISIEYPPSPYDATTRDALLLVHAFHHGTPANFPVGGTAEGLVAGKRRTVELSFTRTSRQGVYALKKQWPTEGRWVLAISVTQETDSKAGALVELGQRGEVSRVTVPTDQRDGWAIPRAISSAEVEAALRSGPVGVASPAPRR
jgi:hypothetical protein